MGLTKLINRQIVKPASPTWEGIMPLTELDHYGIVAREGFVQLYKKPSKPRHIILEIFKNALSRALVWFYPLAGELQSIGKDRYEINCNATGVMLIEAESTSRLEDFGDFSSLDLFDEGLYPNYTQIDGDKIKSPITLVQLTWLQCGSLSIGYATSQVVVDGTAFMHFVRELARLARGEPIISPPILDRQALLQPPPPGLATGSYTPVNPLSRKPSLVVGQISDPEVHLPKPKIRMATLELTKDQVVTLLNIANGSTSGSQGRHYSRFEAIGAHIWRCVVKARGNMSSQRTSICYPIDMRHRMGLPQSYFGVAIMAGVTSSVVEELISIPLGEVCGKIRKQTNAMTKEYVWSVMESTKVKNSMSIDQGFFQGNPNLDITSWLSLPTRDVDYGWGRDVYMAAALEYEGCYVLNRGHEKDGSVLVTFSMDVDHMEDFKNYFYEDINGKLVLMRAKI